MATSSAGQSTTKPGERAGQADDPQCSSATDRLRRWRCRCACPRLSGSRCGNAAVTRNCSNPLFITNTEKLETNGIFPDDARPAPMATMFASAMPHSKKPVREFLAELGGVGGLRKIGVQHHDVRIRRAQLHQRFAERFARGGAEFQFVFGFGAAIMQAPVAPARILLWSARCRGISDCFP